MITHKLLAIFGSDNDLDQPALGLRKPVTPRSQKASSKKVLPMNEVIQKAVEFEVDNVIYVLEEHGKTFTHKCKATLVYSGGRFVEIKNIYKQFGLSDRFQPAANRARLCFRRRVIEDDFENGFPRDINMDNIRELRQLFKRSSGLFGRDALQIRVTSSRVEILNASPAIMKYRDVSLLDYDDSLKSYDMEIEVYSEEKKSFYSKPGYLVIDDGFIVGIRWKDLKEHVDYAPCEEFKVPVKLRPRLEMLIQARNLYIRESVHGKDKSITLVGDDFQLNPFESDYNYIRMMFEKDKIQHTLDRELLPVGLFLEHALALFEFYPTSTTAFSQLYPKFPTVLVDWMNTQDIVDGAINTLLRKPEYIAENNRFTHEICHLLFERSKDASFGIQLYPDRVKVNQFAPLVFLVLASKHFQVLSDFDVSIPKFLENFLFEYRIEEDKNNISSLNICCPVGVTCVEIDYIPKSLTTHLKQLINANPEYYLAMELTKEAPVKRSTFQLRNIILDENNKTLNGIKQALKVAMRLDNYREILRLAKKVTIKQRYLLCDSVASLNAVMASDNLSFRELFYLRTSAKLNMRILDHVFKLGELTSSNLLALNIGGIYKAHWVISEMLKGFIRASDSQTFLNSIEQDYDELLQVYLQKNKSAEKKSRGKVELRYEALKDILCEISNGLHHFIPPISVEDTDAVYPRYDELKKALVEFGLRIAGKVISAGGRFILPNQFNIQMWNADSQLSNDLIKLISLANQYIAFDDIPRGIKRICEFYWQENCPSLSIVHPYRVFEMRMRIQSCDEKYLDERPLVTVNEFDKLHWRLFMYKLFETLSFPMGEYLTHSEIKSRSVNENWDFYVKLFQDFDSQAIDKLFFQEANDRQQALSRQLNQAINEQDMETVKKCVQVLYTLYHVNKYDCERLMDFYANQQVDDENLLQVIRRIKSS